MSSKKRIAVLMTVFNRKDCTIRCLQYLSSQNYDREKYRIDVYLTNDGCTDGTPEAIIERFPEVRIIQGDGNLFWSGGMRKAWDAAAKEYDYDYYFWLNDDTYLYNFALKELLNSSNFHNNKAIIVGPTLSTDLKNTTYGIQMEPGGINPPSGVEKEGDTFNGNIVLIPAFVYHRIGNIDRHLKHAGGDTEYGRVAKEEGIKVIQTRMHLGECDQHERPAKWCDPEISLIDRFKFLNKPNGMPLDVLFYQVRRHFGLLKGIQVVITTITRCAFPRLWTAFKK